MHGHDDTEVKRVGITMRMGGLIILLYNVCAFP